MLEEDTISGSFFEPSPFQEAQSVGPEVDVRESLSFMADSFNINMNIGGNPWDPPSANGIDLSNVLCMFTQLGIYTINLFNLL